MRTLKTEKEPAVESLGAYLAAAGIRVNVRDCRPMDRRAGQAIAGAAEKLRGHYRGRELARDGRGR